MKLNTEKILLMGSPEFVIPTLDTLHAHYGASIKGIITQPDAPKGRNKRQSPTPVKEWAVQHQYTCVTPDSKDTLSKVVKEWDPTLIIVIAYGKILPKEITDTYFCVNAHASILPQYRGASPIQSALLNLDKTTGITLIHMNEKMDEGNILSLSTLEILDSDNFQSLHNKLATLTADALLALIQNSSISETPQDPKHATYCQKLHTENRHLNETDSTDVKLGKIRAFSPHPGAFIIQNGKTIKILNAKKEGSELIPITVKPEGKKAMSYTDYQQGHQAPIRI